MTLYSCVLGSYTCPGRVPLKAEGKSASTCAALCRAAFPHLAVTDTWKSPLRKQTDAVVAQTGTRFGNADEREGRLCVDAHLTVSWQPVGEGLGIRGENVP